MTSTRSDPRWWPHPRPFRLGTPVRHRDKPEVVGVIEGAYWEAKTLWYVIDWLVDGFAPQAKATWVRELPTEMHLLAIVSL